MTDNERGEKAHPQRRSRRGGDHGWRPPGSTRLAFGGAAIGNLLQETTEAEAASAIEQAWQDGVRFFDTAPHYGLGLSESRLGDALRGRARSAFAISTKVGRLLVEEDDPIPDSEGFALRSRLRRRSDFSRSGVLRSLEASMVRLGTDRIDVVYVHDPDEHMDSALNEALPALAELRDSGAVHAVGAGANSAKALTTIVENADVDMVLLAGRYTLLEQGALDNLLPACVRHGVSVVTGGIFNSGLLARPRPSATATYNYLPAPTELIQRATRIAEVCERHGVTLPHAAVHFPLGHPAVTHAAVGWRTAAEVRAAVAYLREPVPDQLWYDLIALGLLREDAPVPVEGAPGLGTGWAGG